MIFTEGRFLAFFLVAFAVAWALRNDRARKAWLLACSYVFYGSWSWPFLGLIAFSTGVDFAIGRALARSDAPRARRVLLVGSLVVNLGLLGLFKYYDFFVVSGVGLLHTLGFEVEPRTLGLVLPVGISFYTFQTLSYTIDVYRRRLPAHESLLDFALFVGFFPQLVAGPIVRAIDFLPQLARRPSFASVAVRANLTLFLVGFIKKACISDNVATVVDTVFADPGAFDAASHALAAALYAVQIYCDFSGYSDMAIASAGILGYRLPDNFLAPYLAQSVTQFWRRWHVTLSTWFRDYLYVPLGGNREGETKTYRNLVIVFVLCGLWHGAAWTFLTWGLFHGAFLAAERVGLGALLERLPRPLRHAYTLIAVMVGWILFRAQDLAGAGAFLAGLIPSSDATLLTVAHASSWTLLLLGLALAHVASVRGLGRAAHRWHDLVWAPAFGAAVAIALLWVARGDAPFIYFQF